MKYEVFSGFGLRFFPVAILLGASACQPKKSTPATTAPAPKLPASAGQLELGEGIIVAFPHKILLDVTIGSDGKHVVRRLLIQAENTRLDDATEQLERSLRFAGFTQLAAIQTPVNTIRGWSKDGKKIATSRFGVAISYITQEMMKPTGGNMTLEIHTQTH
ncbi:MAG: hypothetical protein QM680_06220 [Luteolibacter sp.]